MSHSTFLLFALYRTLFEAKTLCCIQERSQTPETLLHELNSSCWNPGSIQPFLGQCQKQGWRDPVGTTVLLLCSQSSHILNCSSLTRTHTGRDTASAGSGFCDMFTCSPWQGDTTHSRGLVVIWEHKHKTIWGFFWGQTHVDMWFTELTNSTNWPSEQLPRYSKKQR